MGDRLRGGRRAGLSRPALAEVADILDKLPPADASRLSALLEPASWRRERRYRVRDEAVRRCFAELGDMPPKHAARRIEGALGDYLATGWRLHRAGHPLHPPTSLFAAAVRELAIANNGESLGVRQLLNIASGRRR